jgi:hypothetical protein
VAVEIDHPIEAPVIWTGSEHFHRLRSTLFS